MKAPATAAGRRLMEFMLEQFSEPRQPDKEAVVWFVVGDFDCKGAQLDASV